VSASCAQARFPHGVGGVLNACASFTRNVSACNNYAIGIDTGRLPWWQDANTIVDSARSGQIANPNVNPTQYALDVTERTNFYRKFNSFMPCTDLPCGSQNPSDSESDGLCIHRISGALIPAPCYTDPTGTCVYKSHTLGGNPWTPYGGVVPSYILCHLTADNQTVNIVDVDLSNDGSGPNTDSVMIYATATGTVITNATLNISNVYWKCSNIVGTYCYNFATNDTLQFLSTNASSGYNFTNFNLTNVTMDGDIFTRLSQQGNAIAENLIGDSRGGNGQASGRIANIYLKNVLFMNTGHDVVVGNASGSITFDAVYAKDICINLNDGVHPSGCHGEFAEVGAAGGNSPYGGDGRVHASAYYINGTTWVGGTYGSGNYSSETTAPVYMTSGGPSGTIYDHGQVSDLIVFGNAGACSNLPLAGNYPYSPAHPCTISGPGGGWGIISTAWNPVITNLQLDHILADVTSYQSCYNGGGYNSGTSVPNQVTIAFNGTTMTVSNAGPYNPLPISTGFQRNYIGSLWMWPGNSIGVTGGSHSTFINTTILQNQAGGTLSPTATFVGTNLAAGVLTTSASVHLEVGQAVIQAIADGNFTYGYVASGCPGACVAPGTDLSGTSFQLTTLSGGSALTANTFGVNTNLRSYNDTGNCTTANVYCGTYILADSEPVLGPFTLTTDFGIGMAPPGTLTSNNNYWGGVSGDGAGTAITFSKYNTPNAWPAGGTCD
jgi:hypothetical protein